MDNKTNIAEAEWSFDEIILNQSKDVSHEAIAAMRRCADSWSCPKGGSIVLQDQKCDRWVFVSKGITSINYSKDNKTSTLFFDFGGAIFTSFHSYVHNESSIFSVQALTECYGWEIPHDRYRELLRIYPDILNFEVEFLKGQLFSLEASYKRRALSTPMERYRQFWKNWPDLRSAPKLIQDIPLKVIASYLGMSQQHLSKIRRQEIEDSRNADF